MPLLVIGYGNSLRRDDGVGPAVAERLEAMALPGVRALARAQLTPELAEPISQAEAVVFVDAVPGAGPQISWHPVPREQAGEITAHASDPAAVLGLAQQLFGRRPVAWTLAVTVEDLGLGEGLSARACAGVEAACAHLRAFADCQKYW